METVDSNAQTAPVQAEEPDKFEHLDVSMKPFAAQGEAAPAPAKNFAEENVEFKKTGKFGDFGGYDVMADLQPGGTLVSKAEASVDKKFLDFVGVKLAFSASVDADLLDGVLALAAKSNKVWVQKIATKLRGLAGK